jgi:myo-inositol-1-phosphate synthase
VLGASAYFMKSPPIQYDDSTARDLVEEFIAEGASPGSDRP